MINNHEATSLCDIKYKIVFLGDMSVGKSCIIQRFIHNNFDQSKQNTVGIDFLSKNVCYKNHLYRLMLWDTAGQQKYRSLVPNYLRDANCAVFVYDVSNEESFNNLEMWLQLFRNQKRYDASMVIVANKTDLKDKRKVAQEKGFQYANKKQIGYCQVSARRGDGVEVLFEAIIDNILICEKQSKVTDSLGNRQNSPTIVECEQPTSSHRFERIGQTNINPGYNAHSESRINKKVALPVAQFRDQNKNSCCHI